MILLVLLGCVVHCFLCVGVAGVICNTFGLPFNIYFAIGLWVVMMYALGKYREMK